jgi:hypothetical protein
VQTPRGLARLGLLAGRLSGFPEKLRRGEFPILVEGVAADRQPVIESAQLVRVAGTATFRTYMERSRPNPRAAVCLFPGTDQLASASSGYIPIR